MATAAELYALTEESFGEISDLQGFYYDHIPEADISKWDLVDIKTDRIVIKVLKNFYFDHRRFWRLATVWLDGRPVMIIQNAGREGDDHHQRFITNKEKFKEMCGVIRSLVVTELPEDFTLIDDTVDMPELTLFYGNYLGGHFQRDY